MTNRTKAIASLVSVFLLGGVSGALLFGVVVRDHVKEAQDLRRQEGFITYFERRLDLTEAQRDSLHDELAQAYEQLAELRSNASQRYNEVIDTLKSHVYPQLTAEQRELFNAQETKFRRFMPHEPRGRGGPRRRAELLQDRGSAPVPPGDTSRSSAASRKPLSKPAPTGAKGSEASASVSSDPVGDSAVVNEDRMAKALGRIEGLRKQLHLTDDQVRQVRAIAEDARSRARQMRIEYPDQPLVRRKLGRDILRDAQQRIESVLTPEQRDQAQKLRDEYRDKKRGRQGMAGRGGRK